MQIIAALGFSKQLSTIVHIIQFVRIVKLISCTYLCGFYIKYTYICMIYTTHDYNIRLQYDCVVS